MAPTGRSVPWRQGHFLPDEALRSFEVTESADKLAIVISHDCDIVQTPSVEPNVEIVVGRAIETPDGNFKYSKNPRKLHLECTAGTQRFLVELVATDKMAVPKEGETGLLKHAPREDLRLSAHNGPDDPYKLTISLLYSTEAAPDEAEHAAMEVSKSVRSVFKKKCCLDGTH
jgi:hypothetical protein